MALLEEAKAAQVDRLQTLERSTSEQVAKLERQFTKKKSANKSQAGKAMIQKMLNAMF